jgi:hypothetical protein
LSEIVGDGSNLENFLEESAHHILGLTHVTLVAVGEVVVEGLVKLAVVSDCLECKNDISDLRVPVRSQDGDSIENSGNSSLGLLVIAIVSYSVIVILVHSSAVALDETSGKGGEITDLGAPCCGHGLGSGIGSIGIVLIDLRY